MLDANLVLREAEALLDRHYTLWQQGTPGRVRVYEKPQQRPVAQPISPTLPAKNGIGQQAIEQQAHKLAPTSTTPAKAREVSEVVANVFLLLILTVLSDKLARRRPS
jgi:hypothetical protein